MALFTIADLHLSLGTDKPMDIFSGWKDYVERLEAHWRRDVAPQDTVVLPGDISWAMRLEDCHADFAFINALPGQKILLKGNHDYWWTTRNKMEAWLQNNGFSTLHFLHNNCFFYQETALCGTRGWLNEPGAPHDAKVLAREAIRLKLSLDTARAARPGCEAIVFLHYPPVYPGEETRPILDLLAEYGVKQCFYGHLHGGMIPKAVQGRHGGVDFCLVSADALAFSPMKIR